MMFCQINSNKSILALPSLRPKGLHDAYSVQDLSFAIEMGPMETYFFLNIPPKCNSEIRFKQCRKVFKRSDQM